MTTELTCRQVDDQALAERYVTRKLSETETEEFEAHYLTCPRCQNEVRLAAAIGDAVHDVPQQRTGQRAWMVIGGGALAAAAVIALLVLPGTGGPDERLVQLGAVLQAPIYLGVPVRSSEASADSLFNAAMDRYSAARYDEAAAGLESALAAGVDSAPAEFFLGASLLMEDRLRDAADAFERVIALGDTPYLAEAHYYLAKALLRLGRPQEANDHLRTAADGRGELSESATALADSVEELLQR